MPILVAGASKPLGAEIALALSSLGHDVIATRRAPSPQDERLVAAGVALETLDLTDLPAVRRMGQRVSRAVLVPILSVSAPAALVLAKAGVERGVVFSSNNVDVVGADPVYDALRSAEAEVLAGAPDWVILRPTMIYGYPGDGTLSRLLGWLSRYPVVPFPGSGRALQQPVYFNDLAWASAMLAAGYEMFRGIVPYGGPETLPYRGVLDLARGTLGSRALIVHVPIPMIATVARLVGFMGVRPASPAQLSRIELDKHVQAKVDLPAGLQAKCVIGEGLGLLAEDMGLIR